MVNDKSATVKGSCSVLAHAVSMDKIKAGHLKQVPTFITDWCAQADDVGQWREVILVS